MSDEELRALTPAYKQRLADGETLDDLLPEAFATVREAAKRTLGQRHYDVQIMGGAALHLGNIAEMRTGEGKTLVSTLPAYLNALTGDGVHIVTVNDYLAHRDAENMGRVHRFLGLQGRRHPDPDAPGRAPRAVRDGHHLRHEQRVRLRLPARQHGVGAGGDGPARPQLRHRRRDRLDPHRRGAHAADHLRAVRRGRQVVRGDGQARHAAAHRRRLRGRREEEDDRRARAGDRADRGLAGDREPLRAGEHQARRLPQQRDPGQGAVQARP